MPSEVSVASTRECMRKKTLKNKYMLNSKALSTGNAPQLNQLDNDDILYRKDVHRDNNISLTDNVEAFPIIVSAMEETMQTTDPNEPLDGQDSSRLTPISILTADTIGALCSWKILKVLFNPGSTLHQ